MLNRLSVRDLELTFRNIRITDLHGEIINIIDVLFLIERKLFYELW